QLTHGKPVELLIHDRPVEGLTGALVVAVDAGDVKRQQLPHRNSALLVLAGRHPPQVDAPHGDVRARPMVSRLTRPGAAGQEEDRQQAGSSGPHRPWHADDVAATFEKLRSMGAREYPIITPRGEEGFVTAAVVDPSETCSA